jgi:hypothetical protein
MNAMRTGGFVAAAGAKAGTMASRNGKAIAVPAPLRKVLRGMCRRVRKFIGLQLLSSSEKDNC